LPKVAVFLRPSDSPDRGHYYSEFYLAEKGVGNVERMDKYHPAKVRAKIHPTLPNINAYATGDRMTATHLPSLCGL
jgi:hypothetical protein